MSILNTQPIHEFLKCCVRFNYPSDKYIREEEKTLILPDRKTIIRTDFYITNKKNNQVIIVECETYPNIKKIEERRLIFNDKIIFECYYPKTKRYQLSKCVTFIPVELPENILRHSRQLSTQVQIKNQEYGSKSFSVKNIDYDTFYNEVIMYCKLLEKQEKVKLTCIRQEQKGEKQNGEKTIK